jgi:hypothetical protein
MQVMMGHAKGFLAGNVMFNLSLPDLIRQSIIFQMGHFAKKDGYAGQARV